MKYGAQTEYGKLRKVLMHRPDEGMKVVTAGNKNDYLYRDPVYWKAFQKEHDIYTDALKAEASTLSCSMTYLTRGINR